MVDYTRLPIGDQAPSIIYAVVEIPKDSKHKYEYDAKLGVFRLDRVLHSAVYYPAEYGFIPSTDAGDGDALDVMIFLSWPTFPGCVLEVRPIGKLNMVDDKGVDEKILAVAEHDPHYQRVQDLESIEPHVLKEIEQFFGVYKSLEGKLSLTFGWSKKIEAFKRIEACRRTASSGAVSSALFDRAGQPLSDGER
jgi:inorganic pyrophosphatase